MNADSTTRTVPILVREAWLAKSAGHREAVPSPCLAMFSSITGGITLDPVLMQVPVDDHLVHRGDGVFETLKCAEGGIYNLDAHLDRLAVSALGIGLQGRYDSATLKELIIATVRAAGQPNVLIRVLLSRGPGSMGVNPHDCPAAETYIIVSTAATPFMQRQPDGAHLGFSYVPAKPFPFSALKHCNYLPNALMAKEAGDRGLDFIAGLNADGFVLEGPTENIACVTADGFLLAPESSAILAGTTLERLTYLAGPLVRNGTLHGIQQELIAKDTLVAAQEVLITGTSHDLVAVTRIENRPVGSGTPGPVYDHLSRALRAEIYQPSPLRTEIIF